MYKPHTISLRLYIRRIRQFLVSKQALYYPRTWSDEPDLVQVKLDSVGVKALEVEAVPSNARRESWSQVHHKVHPSLS